MTDAQLTHLQAEYARRRISVWTGATYAEYIRDPYHYDWLAAHQCRRFRARSRAKCFCNA